MRNKSRRFLDALLAEVDRQHAAFRLAPATLYFGGGTPTMLSLSELEYLLDGLHRHLAMRDLPGLECTFEVNPATVSAEKAALLRRLGVNRISMGVQSWDDGVLRTLGRAHSAQQARRTFATLRGAGFANINLDLMFAVPGQSLAQWRETLAETVALGPEHVSAYCLTYEEDTEFFDKLRAGSFAQDDDRDADMFEACLDALGAAGFAHYEISNYARPGRESRHNMACWAGADYLGFGPSAFSTCGERRWQNVPDSAAYTERMLAGESAVSFEEYLPPATRRGEIAAFGLRTSLGLPAAALQHRAAEVREFQELGLLQVAGDRVTLTRRGKLMADAVAEAFVE